MYSVHNLRVFCVILGIFINEGILSFVYIWYAKQANQHINMDVYIYTYDVLCFVFFMLGDDTLFNVGWLYLENYYRSCKVKYMLILDI